MTMVEVLNRNLTYAYRDKNEIQWKIVWDGTAGMEGWYAWKRAPKHSRPVCIGSISQEEAVEWINQQPPELTHDDKIDLFLWMKDQKWLSDKRLR